MTMAPDLTAFGINFLDTSDPAEENTISTFLNSNFSRSLIIASLSFP